MVISMASGFSAEDLSASASKSINSALGTIFVLLAVGALIGALFLSGTIASHHAFAATAWLRAPSVRISQAAGDRIAGS